MIIQCENCKRRFQVDETRIKPEGSRVRCSKCGHLFIVLRAEASEDTKLIGNNLNINKIDSSVDDQVNKSESPMSTQENADIQTPDGDTGNEKQTPDMYEKEFSANIEDGTDSQDSIDTFDYNQLSKNVTDDGHAEFESQVKNQDSIVTDENLDSFNVSTGEGFTWDKIDLSEEDSVENKRGRGEDFEKGHARNQPDVLKLDVKEGEILGGSFFEQSNPFESGDSNYENTASNRSFERGSYNNLQHNLPIRSRGKFSILSKVFYAIISIAILIIIVIASLIIMASLDIISTKQINKGREIVQSIIPFYSSNSEKKNIYVNVDASGWLTTKNGLLYIVSGTVTNDSKSDSLNFIKLKGEYSAADQILYEQTLYAGNTFTKNQLKVLTIQDILLRLQRKDGDINYDNYNKLTGLNYDIKPGESIPFYSIFPSNDRILGLKYRLEVVDYSINYNE